MEGSTTQGPTANSPGKGDTVSVQSKIALYIGLSVGVGILICVIVLIFILMYRKGKIQLRRKSVRHLFLRGFSTVSERGVLDSTGEFEMVNTSATASVSSEDAQTSQNNNRKGTKGKRATPKKPDRRRRSRSRTSSSNAQYENVALSNNTQYENVTLKPQVGFVVRKSISMSSEIPFIDGTGTLDPKLTAERHEDELDDDDVFQ